MVGSIILGDTYGGAEWRNIVSDIIVHPKFSELDVTFIARQYVNDFAMMKIEAVTNANLTPAVLNSVATLPTMNQNLVAMGYGRIAAYGLYEPSYGLRSVTLVANNTDCPKFQAYLPRTSFCAQATGRDVCEGMLSWTCTPPFVYPPLKWKLTFFLQATTVRRSWTRTIRCWVC